MVWIGSLVVSMLTCRTQWSQGRDSVPNHCTLK